jgi:hypothetical protein
MYDARSRHCRVAYPAGLLQRVREHVADDDPLRKKHFGDPARVR